MDSNMDVDYKKFLAPEDIDILIYSSPKTAGNCLLLNLLQADYKLYYTHSCSFFSEKFPGQNNQTTLKEYIENTSRDKPLVIITIYREFIDRIKSLYFQSFKYLYKNDFTDINDVSTEELIEYFNNIILPNYINEYKMNNYYGVCGEGIFELFPKEINKINYETNNTSEYFSWKNNNIHFIVLRFDKIQNWANVLNKELNNTNISLILSRNNSNDKLYHDKYLDFKTKYTVPESLYSEIYDTSPTILYKIQSADAASLSEYTKATVVKEINNIIEDTVLDEHGETNLPNNEGCNVDLSQCHPDLPHDTEYLKKYWMY
jgi:hypothetical protein